MSSTNKLVIIIAVILIIICLIVGNRKAHETNIVDTQNLEQIRGITYDTLKNEITGEEEYIVYDKETGEEITRVDEEYKLKIYEIDPNYEEIFVDIQTEESDIIE